MSKPVKRKLPTARLVFLKRLEIVFVFLCWLVLFICFLVILFLLLKLLSEGISVLKPAFLTSYPSRFPEHAGILPAWIGTCLVMLVAMVIAIPLGVGAAVYLEQYARPEQWLSRVIEVNIITLAGMPAIVYGLLALSLFIDFLQLGSSILTAGLTLALLILPIVIVSSREAIKTCPRSLIEAAYGMGASKILVIKDYVLPHAFPGILTGIILGVARAVGEASPLVVLGAVTFIVFLPDSPFTASFPYVSWHWLSSSFTVMPIQILNWLSRPGHDFRPNAAAASFILVVMTLAMNAFAIYLRYLLRRSPSS